MRNTASTIHALQCLSCALLFACTDDSTDLPWASPACYDKYGEYHSSALQVGDANFFWPPIYADLIDIATGASKHAVTAKGVVFGDTYHGWKYPTGRGTGGIAVSKAYLNNMKADDFAISSLNSDAACRLQNMTGASITVGTARRTPWEDVDGAASSASITLRNNDGQLLIGHLEGTTSEHASELIPEMRFTNVPDASALRTAACVAKNGGAGQYTWRYGRIRIHTKNEVREVKPHQDGSSRVIAIHVGCVEYLVRALSKVVISMKDCAKSEEHFTADIVRRTLLDAACAP